MKVSILKKTFKVLQCVALSLTVFFSSAVQVSAANLSMATTPLFLGAAVQPNVFFVSDDSGSMDWEFMTPAHWRWSNYDPDPIRNGTYSSGTAISSRNTTGTLNSAEFQSTDSDDGGYGYIYRNSDNAYDSIHSCTANYYRGSTEACGDTTNHPLDVDWRARAAALNTLFYNANIEYQPWDGPCDTSGTACANASFTAVRSDPYSTQTGYSITRNLSTDGDANNGAFIYEVWIDDSGYTGTRPLRGTNFNETGYAASAFAAPTVDGLGNITSDVANGEIDLWDSHLKFTVSNSGINVKLIAYNPIPSGVSQGLNETVLVNTDISNPACYNVLGSTSMVKTIRDAMVKNIAGGAAYAHAENAPGCKTIAEIRQNTANWYEYYRRRAFPVKNAIAEVIDAQPNFRFGMTVLNKYNTLFTQVPDVSVTNFSAHNTSIKQKYFAFDQPAVGTPLREALYRAGQYYDDTLTSPSADDPIVYSCQKNFTILFTDGFWSSTSFSSVGNSDGDAKSNSLADVAYHFYKKVDLSTLPDNVKPDLPLESDLPAVALDPLFPDDKTTHQHMVTFTVAFGVTGKMSDTDGDKLPDLTSAGNAWPTGEPTKDGDWGDASNDQEKIDDLWHTAYNSAGVFASASTPTEVSEKLIEAISAIAERVGSASAVALNSGTLNANSRLYQAQFNSNGWSGDITSIPIQDGVVDKTGPAGIPDGVDDSPAECNLFPAVGELCDVEWSAAAELSTLAAASRNIFTIESDGYTAVAFKALSDLGAAQQTSLKTNPDTLVVEADSIGQQRLDYIRGDHAKEADQSGGSFRIRADVKNIAGSVIGKSVLGDVIHSAPAYVSAPNFFYPNTLEAGKYTEFKFLNKDRAGVVYVGANDGMLHAFDSTTGIEKFAYVPGAMIGKLNQLTSVKYNSGHNYYVDGSPIVFDAYDSAWKTMLAASVGAGAQLVYGLDVTDPDSFSAANIKWEFTDNPRSDGAGTYGDIDLGYTIGDVSYGKMNNGEWAVIFGNGYNNTFADGNKSTTGNGVIYVVNAFTGALIKKFNTGIGMSSDPTGGAHPNGVASVTPIDIDGDLKVDYLYAGDLFGNVWKVDVTSSSESSWVIANSVKPIFVAKDVNGDEQAITSAVTVKRHPIERDQTLVLFGTGKFFEVGDSANSGAATQIQTFYGIWDDNKGAQYVRSNLLEQKILQQLVVTGVDGEPREFRVTSSEKDDLAYKMDWSTDKGWYMDLRFGTEFGERVIVNPIIRNNRIIFVTQTPDEDPCSAGGSSWIMEINANDGNRLDVPPFDVNGDGIIDDNDVVTYLSDAATITSGVRSKSGIVASPGILNKSGGGEIKYLAGTKGTVDVVEESASDEFRKRQSWRQLR